MSELGSDAPTLCEGWTTVDLAAHLVLREHFRRWGDDRIAAEKAKGFASLIERLRRGAPPVPWRLPGIRTIANGLEYYIHHEDVRRANGRAPRTGIADLERLSWRMSGFLGRRLARRIHPYSLELTTPDARLRRFGSGEVVNLRGPATELVLYLSGRRSAAQVDLFGSDEAMAMVNKAVTNL
jgi:uncharacterized protein (TIGR03085 family)